MKYFLIILSISVYSSTCQSPKPTDVAATIYLVRHAEKAKDGTRDPDLTDQGRARAQRIANMLKDEQLTAVYSSDFKRTRNTAAPTAKMQGKEITIYNARDLKGFKAELMKKYKNGEKILVVGHSNTTPFLANLLTQEGKYKQIDESDYDNFYKIEVLRNGNWNAELTTCE
jgi:broad specificity phosphatase PhoE